MNKENVYRLQGLSCANCAQKFEKNIHHIETVTDAKVNFGASKVTVHGEVTIEQLEKAGAFDNIKVIPETEDPTPERLAFFNKQENLSTLIAGILLFLGLGLQFYLGKNNPIVITTFIISIIVGGYDLFFAGVKNLLRFYFDMKTLMTIAVIGASFIGEWVEAAVVVLLFAISEALESYSIDKARQSIRALMDIAPNQAFVRRDHQILQLDVKDIKIGDIIVIKPGEKIAMDGEVIEGKTSINQAAITGESLPVHKTIGDEVFAGTINEEGYIEVRVTKLVEDTTLAKIIHLVEDAQAEKAPAQHFVDRFATYYTPAIMIIAFLVAIVPPLAFGAAWSHWVYLGLATLVVGCPCALIISTPVAIVTAIGNAARHGVLIKGGAYLEETGHIDVIAFDKTGTITKGTPEVTNIISLTGMDTEEILKIATAIENYSQHPIASAIIRETKKRNIIAYEANNFQSITGKGATATINQKRYFIGNVSLFTKESSQGNIPYEQITSLQQEGKTVMLIGTESEIIAIIAVADQVRQSSRTVIDKLKRLGIRQIMLTGDNENTAKTIANKIGITEVKAGLLPEEKLSAIKKELSANKYVAMVGDGKIGRASCRERV